MNNTIAEPSFEQPEEFTPESEHDIVSREMHPAQGRSAADVRELLRDPLAREQAIQARRRQMLAQRTLGNRLEIIARRTTDI